MSDPLHPTPTEEEMKDRLLVPVVVENPLLVKQLRKNTKLTIAVLVLITTNIAFSVFSLSIIYGNQSQLYRASHKNQGVSSEDAESICTDTAKAVADEIVSGVAAKNAKQSNRALTQLENAAKAAKNR